MDRLLPSWAVPYSQLARWDRPIGTWLLLWPCLWSIGFAAPAGALPDLPLCLLFTTGAIAMRGAGCTVNDLWDRDFDRQVERTRHRPLAAGTLRPAQAVGFLGVQLSVALGVLLAMPLPAVACGLAATPLWVGYPLAKRFTDWPQAVLGLAINWGALLGWVAVHGAVDPVLMPLYGGAFLWTLHYDTIYAHQDARDDAKAGVRSTALRLAGETSDYLRKFDAGAVALLAAAGGLAGLASQPVFWAGLAAAYAHLEWQRRTADFSSPAACLRLFRSNRDFGAIVCITIVLAKLLQQRRAEEEIPERDGWRRLTGYQLLGGLLVSDPGARARPLSAAPCQPPWFLP